MYVNTITYLYHSSLHIDNSNTSYVTTRNGSLVITTSSNHSYWTEWNGFENAINQKNYTSGMLQSWNKFCFTGGLLEMSIKLPGNANGPSNTFVFHYMSNYSTITIYDNIYVLTVSVYVYAIQSYGLLCG